MPESELTNQPGKILSIAQLMVLIGTLIYLFAFMRADVDSNKQRIQVQEEKFQQMRSDNRNTYVRRDVFNEQYRQIIERLDNLNEKLTD